MFQPAFNKDIQNWIITIDYFKLTFGTQLVEQRQVFTAEVIREVGGGQK